LFRKIVDRTKLIFQNNAAEIVSFRTERPLRTTIVHGFDTCKNNVFSVSIVVTNRVKRRKSGTIWKRQTRTFASLRDRCRVTRCTQIQRLNVDYKLFRWIGLRSRFRTRCRIIVRIFKFSQSCYWNITCLQTNAKHIITAHGIRTRLFISVNQIAKIVYV